MPKVDETPKYVKPYLAHGVELRENGDHWLGDCPFCGRERKFSVNAGTGQWRCYVCGEGTERGGGNAYTFIRRLYESASPLGPESSLAANRKVEPATLAAWGARRHPITDEVCLPGFGADGKVNQLYRYVRAAGEDRLRLLPTPGLEHALHAPTDPPGPHETVYVAEGPWDGMALWEALRGHRAGEGGYVRTGNVAASAAAGCRVVAVPGCTTFRDAWLPLFAGKRVVLCYDSDRPRVNPKTGKEAPPAGLEGMRMAARRLASKAEHAPASVEYLEWGPSGWDPDLPSGYDVRDHLNNGQGKGAALADLLGRVRPIPPDWVGGRGAVAARSGSTELELLECESWRELNQAWRKALNWHDGLDRALSVMLAAILSTEAVGDQLWVKVIGPPACGKSVLAEAVSSCKKYVAAKSTIRGFHSGYRESSDEKEDNSLLALVRNKALVTKDGDTLLQSPNLPQILSEARDVYDRVSRTHYRNKASKDYENYSLVWILMGTESLRSIDSSELGERFLDCVVMDRIDDDEERATALRVARRSSEALKLRAADGESDDPAILRAKRLTGGYVKYLRENDNDLLCGVVEDDAALAQCVDLATFVAYMRARPSGRQKEKQQREMCFRLTSQVVRLANCLAVVLNRDRLDADVMRRTRACAIDTARGRTYELCRWMRRAEGGLASDSLAMYTGHDKAEEKALLKFLRRLGAVRTNADDLAPGESLRPGTGLRWRLSDRMRGLWDAVVGEVA